MKYSAIILAALLGVAASHFALRDAVQVMKMGLQNEEADFLDKLKTMSLKDEHQKLQKAWKILSKPLDMYKKLGVSSRQTLGDFKWKNCGKTGSPVTINSLKISPDPVGLPGPVTIGFDISIAQDVNTNLTVKMDLKKKFAGGELPIPCLDKFIGSCTYHLCELLAPIPQCPPEFLAAGVPCKCPFKQGKYNLPGISFTVLASVFLPGDYHAIANISDSKGDLGCLELFATIING